MFLTISRFLYLLISFCIVVFALLSAYQFVLLHFNEDNNSVSTAEEITNFIALNDCHKSELTRLALNSQVIRRYKIDFVKDSCKKQNDLRSPLADQAEALGLVGKSIPFYE